MITLQHRHIHSFAFMQALNGLASQRVKMRTANNIARIHSACNREYKETEPLMKKLLDTHFKKDLKGNAIMAKDSSGKDVPGRFELLKPTTEGKEAYDKELEDFMSLEFKIDRSPLKMSDLVDVDGKEISVDAVTLSELLEIFEDEDTTS